MFRAVSACEGRFLFRIPLGFERPDGSVLRAAIAKYGDVKFIRKTENARDVVGVFVRDEDCGKFFRRLANRGEAFADLQRRKPRVHQDARLAAFDVGAVAGRTAAEDGELNGHEIKLRRKAERGKRKANLHGSNLNLVGVVAAPLDQF